MKTDKFNNLLTVLLKYISISFQRPLKNLDSLLIFSDYNADIMLSRSWNNNSLHYAKNYSSIITSPLTRIPIHFQAS